MEWLVMLFVLVVFMGMARAANQGEGSQSAASQQWAADSSAKVEPELQLQVSFSNHGVASSNRLSKGPKSTSRDCWKPKGQKVEIGRYTIDGGWLYVGKNLPSISEWRGVEPALIDPSLPRSDANPDPGGEDMPYWPGYSSISRRCRSGYLEWLASGRSDPDTNIGYVFLYFYGIERRTLIDAKSLAEARGEIPELTSEVRRLLSIYGSHHSFHSYATRFLEFLELQSDRWEPPPEPPDEMPETADLPLTLRLAVGHMAAKGTPLPYPWALAWVRRDRNIVLRTPASRCQEAFDELFRIWYLEKYGSGIRLKACKRKVSIQYRPASPSFMQSLEIITPFPDVTRLVGPRRKIHDLARKCSDALDSYSRWLGRNPEGRGSLHSAALLPPELLATRAPEELTQLQSALADGLGDRSVVLLACEDVLGPWFAEGKNKLTKQQAVQAAHVIGHAGFGFEPDVRFCGTKPEKASQVAVFRLAEGESGSPSVEYSAAVVLMYLAAMVSAADGDVSFDEKRHLRDHMATSLDLHANEIQRLGAYLEWLLANPPSRVGGKKKLERLSPDQRKAIGELLVSVVCADGRIEPQEIKALTSIFRFLDLDPGKVHDWLHAQQASGGSAPVSVVSAGPDDGPRGFPLPQRPESEGEPDYAVQLDPAIIAAKLKESERAALTLASIFVDEEEELAPTPTSETEGSTVEGLDAPHTRLLERLAIVPSWSRAAYESLADELGMLPDGALDLLNDAAFELCEEPVVEGYDPLEISSAVIQEMLASREMST
ncbi:MAG: TerB N-terminal domain-containing protein [Acidobacteriota bacterium]